eukprot:TRINITY_DN113620_c0_g1_i1.p1 TRINITY_DN113620_c0_g1~~TRINITY_DN113620_c0_g1_i1.p1  ORF type:complete len:199 (-),score=29.89 TRINITY_DN113620_c0_g1_i1:61-657(-)
MQAAEAVGTSSPMAESDAGRAGVTVGAGSPHPKPWHCFGPLMPGRSSSDGSRRPSRATNCGVSPGKCLCGGGSCTPRALPPCSSAEVGCGIFPNNSTSGSPWVCAVLPADSDGEADPLSSPRSAGRSQAEADRNGEERSGASATPQDADGGHALDPDLISVTSTCSPNPGTLDIQVSGFSGEVSSMDSEVSSRQTLSI